MSNWFDTLDTYWSEALRLLDACPTSSETDARFCTLATIGKEGPEARIVVCRSFDANKLEAHFFTDSATSKVKELRQDPRATLLFWFSAQSLQIRLRGDVTIAQGRDETWDALPDASKAGYGPTPLPGTQIEQPAARNVTPDITRFSACTFRARSLEALHLDRPHHHRALFTRERGWSGQWIAP